MTSWIIYVGFCTKKQIDVKKGYNNFLNSDLLGPSRASIFYAGRLDQVAKPSLLAPVPSQTEQENFLIFFLKKI